MPLSELTSRDAVISAIREYDTLGQDAFLRKYGYGRSRDYLLEFEGKTYDSKAIVGASYGIQHPAEGPLKHNDFSGGLARVEPVLRRLGFQLSQIDPTSNVSNIEHLNTRAVSTEASNSSISFEPTEFALFSRYPSSKPFGDVAEMDKALFKTIRQKLKTIAETTASSFSSTLSMEAHASLYSPNGRSATDLWCCIYPAAVPNKSFGLQFALILNQHGAEFCCCLGAGTSQVSNPVAVNDNAAALAQVRNRLASLSHTTVEAVVAAIGDKWNFRKQWRLAPGTKDFSSLSEWLAYASSPTSSGASISKNLTTAEVIQLGTDVEALFQQYADLFKPLIEAAYIQQVALPLESTHSNALEFSGAFNTSRVNSAARLFQWIYGDAGFDADAYLLEERTYKLSLSEEWRKIASAERFQAALAGGLPADQLVREITDLLCDPKKSNLLPWRYSDVLRGPWNNDQSEVFLRATNALLFEGDRTNPPIDEFNKAMAPFYSAKLTDAIKPASHCIPSLMLWLSDPTYHFFVRPGLYNRASVALTGSVADGQGNVMTTAYYVGAVKFAHALMKELARINLKPRDFIDVQGFLWGVFSHSKIWFGGKSYGSTKDMLPEFLKRKVYAVGFSRTSEIAKQFENIPQLKKQEREQRRSNLEKLLADGAEQKAMTAFFDLISAPGGLLLAKSCFYSQRLKKSILRISAVGYVRDSYLFDPEIGHQIEVDWRGEPHYDAELIGPMFPRLAGTLTSLPIADALDAIGIEIDDAETSPVEIEPAPAPIIEPALPQQPPKLQPIYKVEDFVRETRVQNKKVENWLARANRKRQLILQGPPGTGKTFYAERLARLIVSNTAGISEIVQFHPSYAYEDFMQGIRPQVVSGSLSYNIEPGRFLQFCQRASERGNAPSVLIIDEINRANLSRVFGELMYLLEYRDKEAPLAVGGKPFKIPKNVYLIGTMNTADRSIALVDHALRRRFSFIYLEPDYDVLQAHLSDNGLPAESLVNTLKAINAAIDDRHYAVGISFFLADGKELGTTLEDIWRGEIEPYLEEFFYDQEEKAKAFRWDTLVNKALADWA